MDDGILVARPVPIAPHRRHIVDESFIERIIPRSGNDGIDAAKRIITHDKTRISEDEDKSSLRTPHTRSLSETSGLASLATSIGVDHSQPPDVFAPAVLSTTEVPSKSRRRPDDATEALDHIQNGGSIPTDHPVSVAKTRPSRAERESSASHKTLPTKTEHSSQRMPRPEEIEAARRILAQLQTHEMEDAYEARLLQSATPPPIGRPRRLIYDDSEEDYDKNFEDEEVAVTPIATARSKRETPPRRPISRSHSHVTASSHHPTAPSVVTDIKTRRTPMLDHLRLYEDVDDLPPLEPRSVWSSHRGGKTSYLHMDEEMDHVGSLRNGAGDTPGRRPRTASRRAYSDDGVSVSRPSMSHQSIVSGSDTRMPDFLGPGIFQVVLHNPTTAHQLLKFSETRFCGENVQFLTKVEQYQHILNDLATTMATIHKDFISENSPTQVNVAQGIMKTVHTEMKSVVVTTLPSMEILFREMQEHIEQLVFTDIYPRFVRYQLTLSATRALATDRHQYQGLGDCFCLTNPTKADNPIVFASDGFVKVTGYTRPEIIPRNCRFLQGSHTDRVSVRRLRNAIGERKESVELLLNYKKNGDPFWNLLYVAPLYNEQGKVAFFLGGQVNCSTTIHSNVDVMRILSASSTSDVEEEKPKLKPMPNRQSTLPSARKALFKAFGVRVEHKNEVPLGDAGIERVTLDRMEGQDLNAQMKEFYTAYSKYIVVRADNFMISFYSDGITDMLHPANSAANMIVGTDIFRFFKQNMVNHQTDYKARVRNAIRMGQPASVEIRLQTRRSAMFRGDERFVSHWTPLKNDLAAVHYVVITLAPAII